MSFCSLIKEITPKIFTLCFVLINRVILNLVCVSILSILCRRRTSNLHEPFLIRMDRRWSCPSESEMARRIDLYENREYISMYLQLFHVPCLALAFRFVLCQWRAEEEKDRSDVDDISVTQSDLVCNITKTDCLKKKSTEGSLFASFKRQFQAGCEIDRIAAVYLFLFDSCC